MKGDAGFLLNNMIAKYSLAADKYSISVKALEKLSSSGAAAHLPYSLFMHLLHHLILVFRRHIGYSFLHPLLEPFPLTRHHAPELFLHPTDASLPVS